MRKVVLSDWMTLDGVVQGPSSEHEDPSDGFDRGGWHTRYFDDRALEWVVRNVEEAGGFLFGRRTYEIFAAYWPTAGEEEQALARPLNSKPKHVAAATLDEPLSWENSILLKGDVAEAVAALRRTDGGPLYVIGSTRLVATLIAHDLVDELRLMIDPLVLGGRGKRLFPADGPALPMRLTECEPTTTGALLAVYTRA